MNNGDDRDDKKRREEDEFIREFERRRNLRSATLPPLTNRRRTPTPRRTNMAGEVVPSSRPEPKIPNKVRENLDTLRNSDMELMKSLYEKLLIDQTLPKLFGLNMNSITNAIDRKITSSEILNLPSIAAVLESERVVLRYLAGKITLKQANELLDEYETIINKNSYETTVILQKSLNNTALTFFAILSILSSLALSGSYFITPIITFAIRERWNNYCTISKNIFDLLANIRATEIPALLKVVETMFSIEKDVERIDQDNSRTEALLLDMAVSKEMVPYDKSARILQKKMNSTYLEFQSNLKNQMVFYGIKQISEKGLSVLDLVDLNMDNVEWIKKLLQTSTTYSYDVANRISGGGTESFKNRLQMELYNFNNALVMSKNDIDIVYGITTGHTDVIMRGVDYIPMMLIVLMVLTFVYHLIVNKLSMRRASKEKESRKDKDRRRR